MHEEFIPDEDEDCEMRMIVSPIPKVFRRHSYTRKDESKRPVGLSKKVRLKEYRADPVFHLSTFNYKVNARAGSDKKSAKYLLSEIDTGAGPNLIREQCCPPDVLNKLRTDREVANLKSASNHTMVFLWIVKLSVTVGTYTV